MNVEEIKIVGSLVGTRQDMAECIEIAAQGKIKAKIEIQPFEAVNYVLQRLKEGKVNGGVVLKIS